MKHTLLIISLWLAGAVIHTSAQTKERFYSERFGDNIFVGAGAGIHSNLNPDNFDYGIANAIAPAVTLSLGKLFTPVWGARIQAAGAWSTLYTNRGLANNEFNKIQKNYIALHADALYSLSDAIYGYNPDRIFRLYAFAGPGLTFAKTYGNQENINALINGSLGLMMTFSLNKYLDIHAEARGGVSPSIFGNYSSAYTDGTLSLTAGITYTFSGKKFVSCEGVNRDAINAEINSYRAKLAELEDELNRCKSNLRSQEPAVREVTKEVVRKVAGPRAVFFPIGQHNIDDYGMVNIRMAAKIIKENPEKKYKIAGYADQATGSARINQQLSEKRAQAVYDALIKEGVNASQLEIVGFGGSNMFDKDKLNRVVILE